MTIDFLTQLTALIEERKGAEAGASYTASLFSKGTSAIAQKVGEEAVEVVIEAMRGDKARLVSEGADLLYHFLVLLAQCGSSLPEVVAELERRHSKK